MHERWYNGAPHTHNTVHKTRNAVNYESIFAHEKSNNNNDDDYDDNNENEMSEQHKNCEINK